MSSIVLSPDAEPSAPEEGELYYDSATDKLKVRDSAGFRQVVSVDSSGKVQANLLTGTIDQSVITNSQTNITGLGTVTSGTINSTVDVQGVPKLIKATRIKHASTLAISHNAWTVVHNNAAGSFDQVSGRTYLIHSMFNIQLLDRAATENAGRVAIFGPDTSGRIKGSSLSSNTPPQLCSYDVFSRGPSANSGGVGLPINLFAMYTASSSVTGARISIAARSDAGVANQMYFTNNNSYAEHSASLLIYEITGITLTDYDDS